MQRLIQESHRDELCVMGMDEVDRIEEEEHKCGEGTKYCEQIGYDVDNDSESYDNGMKVV